MLGAREKPGPPKLHGYYNSLIPFLGFRVCLFVYSEETNEWANVGYFGRMSEVKEATVEEVLTDDHALARALCFDWRFLSTTQWVGRLRRGRGKVDGKDLFGVSEWGFEINGERR